VNEQEFAELAAGFALNALTPDDLAAFTRARSDHPEWEHLVQADAETAALLADGVADVAPPLTARSTLLARIASTPQGADAAAAASEMPPAPTRDAQTAAEEPPYVDPSPTTSTIQAVSRRNWTRGLLALAASLVLLVVLGYGAVSINEIVNRPPAVAALAEIEAAPDAQTSSAELADGGTATVHWSESVGKAVLVSDDLPEIATDESFEMWFVGEDGAVSAGTFAAPDGSSTTLLDGDVVAGGAVAVSVEPEGGSPTGQPSTEPIVVIPTA
jgi:anti-sigma-K factor RskA